MSGIFFYTLVIGLTSGILFRSFFVTTVPDVMFLLFLSFACALLWRLKNRPYASTLFVTSLFILSFGIGIIRLDLSEVHVSPLHAEVGETKVWEGIVAREPDERQTSTHLYVRELQTDTLMLVIVDPFVNVAYGDSISVRGTLKEPEAFETDTGRTFDYKGYLKARGVHEMISYAEIAVVRSGEGNKVLDILYAFKHRVMKSLEQALPEPAAGLGEGVLLGVKRALGEDLSEMFRIAGIIHIVVLSGYNIMIVADSTMRLLGYIFFPRTRLILGIGTIILFALLVGLSATVVRATIMAALVLIARATGRRYAVLRALCLTGVLMLFINPHLLAFDPGFQLSFLATLGLILFSPILEERFTAIPERFGIRGYLATTLGTQLYVLPLLLFSMGTLSLVSVAVNLLVLPVVPLAMLLTFIVGVLGVFSATLGLVVGFGAYFVLMYIVTVASLGASLPFAALTVPAFPAWVLGIMYVGIGVGTYFLLKKQDTKEALTEELSDWTIVTENETTSGTARVPRAVSDPLPFK